MDIEQYTLDYKSSIFLLIVKASHRMNGTCRNIYSVCIKIKIEARKTKLEREGRRREDFGSSLEIGEGCRCHLF